MAVIIQKYGGTSLGTLERVSNVANLIAKSYNSGNKLVVVVSAMAGETNRLLSLAHDIVGNNADIERRELDVLASTGEQVTTALLSLALNAIGIKTKSYCGWQVPIRTTNDFTNARIKYIDTNKIVSDINSGMVVIVAGFQGVTDDGAITTFGRGGSDTSAVALAVTLMAHECQIYTDVNGIFTADPNKVAIAKRIPEINGACMLEAASLGTKVLHVRSCELGYRYKTNIRVLSTFAPLDQGTLVMNQHELENYPIINLSVEENQALVTFEVLNDLPQILNIIYDDHNIDMLHIGSGTITFVVGAMEVDSLRLLLDPLINTLVNNLVITQNLTKISLIGSGFRSNRGLNQQVWQLLKDSEVFAIAHNEISVSILVHNWEAAAVRNKLSQVLLE